MPFCLSTAIDVALTGHTVHNLTITRTSPGNYSLAADITYIQGYFPINLVTVPWNFDIETIASDHMGSSALFAEFDQTMQIAVQEKRRSLPIAGSLSLKGTLLYGMNYSQCLALGYIGLTLTEGWRSSYMDSNKTNNIYWVNVTTLKKCHPGKN